MLRADGRTNREARPSNCGPARNPGETCSDECFCISKIDVAGDYKHCVVRRIKCLEETLHVLDGRVSEVLHRSDHGVMVRMVYRIDVIQRFLEPRSVRLVVA